MHNRQLTEIFVEGDEDSARPVRISKNFPIAGVLRLVATPFGIISSLFERSSRPTPYTGV